MKYYSVAVDRNEAMSRAKVFAELCKGTDAACVMPGSSEDPSLYVMYDTEDHRDAAYQGLKDVLRSARKIHSPHIVEDVNTTEAE